VDSRPSDAIALALRSRSEIFVEEGVLEKSKTLRAEGSEPDPERLKKWLEEVNPEDLGKYRM
jgi:bifunctional DNase/RNase